MKCLQCQKETSNPKFCSRSCAASYNNKKFPKRTKKDNLCTICEKIIPSRRKYCLDCNPNIADWNNITLGSLKSRYKYQKSARIRSLARAKIIKLGLELKCRVCGYKKHVEVCHIKPINSFSDSAKITEINSTNNLALLCPNCHWEFDHNGLKL